MGWIWRGKFLVFAMVRSTRYILYYSVWGIQDKIIKRKGNVDIFMIRHIAWALFKWPDVVEFIYKQYEELWSINCEGENHIADLDSICSLKFWWNDQADKLKFDLEFWSLFAESCWIFLWLLLIHELVSIPKGFQTHFW